MEPGSETDEPAAEGEEIEIVVTGEQETEGYSVPNASTATRTDTPIRDIPQSIQVVPQQVLEDRNVRIINEAVETVSGVANGEDNFGASGGARIIRGFQQDGNFRNGYRDGDVYTLTPIGTIEQVEVLKGPALVLFGAIEPGGIVNVTTKQPLSEPYYNLAFEAGNYELYQPSIDLSRPLNTDKTVLYRFIASYQSAGSFVDFVNTDQITIAPSITLTLGDRTDLNLYYEYLSFYADPPIREVPLLSDGSLPARNFYPSYPFHIFDYTSHRFGYTLHHSFSDSWQIRNGFSVLQSRIQRLDNFFTGVVDDRVLTGFETYDTDYTIDTYSGQIDLLGKFKTGSVSHQLLLGFNFNRYFQDYRGDINTGSLPDLDIFNPNYDVPSPAVEQWFKFDQTIQSYGIYLQDQIALGDKLKLLVGGRYDWLTYEFETLDYGLLGNTTDDPSQSNQAFSPRIGLVYQPSDTVSLYASYSRSFRQTTGFNPDGEAFKPTRGTQYEIGIKADFLDGQLSTTLAAYQINKTNVNTPDPNSTLFSIQTGEQRSRGIELDVAGEILPGWKAIASYAYTDAKTTEDNAISVGNRLGNVPENQASLWTTYQIQDGALRGLGFGLELFYVCERQGDLDNTFTVPDYLRTDAALYYRRDRFNAAINIRNLFDIDYVRITGFGLLDNQRGAPFTITGSVSWEF